MNEVHVINTNEMAVAIDECFDMMLVVGESCYPCLSLLSKRYFYFALRIKLL